MTNERVNEPSADRVPLHYRSVARDYWKQYEAGHDEYPANKIRLDMILPRLVETGARSVLDCGCGEGTPMLRIAEAGIQVWGFDFVEEMAEQSRETLTRVGLQDRVWQGDITTPTTFDIARQRSGSDFDAVLAWGVLPHVSDEVPVLKLMRGAVKVGGRVYVEFRNELFSLFTLNRYSFEFLRDVLVNVEGVRSESPKAAEELEAALDGARRFFEMDQPARRTGDADAPGYDEIPARFHNPLLLPVSFAAAGLRIQSIYYYHHHILPPSLEALAPEVFLTESLQLEKDPTDWRGMFMASAFVVEALRDE